MPSSERAKFAVGYFFLSVFEPLRKHINKVGEIRLLIGNTTNYQTLEKLSEGYKRLELVEEAEKHIKFIKRADEKRKLYMVKIIILKYRAGLTSCGMNRKISMKL